MPGREEDALAAGAIDEQDERVLRELAALYDEQDPVPPRLVARLQFGLTLDALESEVAQLQRLEAAGARSDEFTDATAAQTVTFTSASLTTMVTISPAGPDRVRIDGWVAPGAGVRVELRVVGDRLATVADSDGRFVFEDVPRGLAQFVLRSAVADAHPPVMTPSIDL
jgi:hypothetical protein